ncbi:hypothetical protein OHB12_17530 [Nocardia sp. NBC_01730]|uniref:hypothetical protein n=1 Tax=Nocardia sp. NBC_01730 TaxID=2975998 RepID=UPI002E122D0E|nr:hypothetical protein OHB12_17530 [Nocardia sp. NBC_01730]
MVDPADDGHCPGSAPRRPEDASAIAEVWHHGWRDAHLGYVPDALLTVRPRRTAANP